MASVPQSKRANSHDNSVRSLQVETKTTRACRQDEDLVLRVGSVEESDVPSTVLGLRATIETEVLPAHHLQEVLHDVHHLGHLEENEHLGRRADERMWISWTRGKAYSVTGGEELRQDS